MLTTKGWIAPVPSYSVVTPVPASDTQKAPVGEYATPQGLTRFGSTTAAGTAPSDTRFVCTKSLAAAAVHSIVVLRMRVTRESCIVCLLPGAVGSAAS